MCRVYACAVDAYHYVIASDLINFWQAQAEIEIEHPCMATVTRLSFVSSFCRFPAFVDRHQLERLSHAEGQD